MKTEDLAKRAQELDEQSVVAEAADAYEELVASGAAELQAYLNLAVLYFQCFDFGFAAGHQLDDELIRSSLDRAFQTLDRAEEKFGQHNEISFWRHYIRFICLGGEPDLEAVEEMVRMGPSSVPQFFLLMRDSGPEIAREAEKLLETLGPARSERGRYVASVLEAVIARNNPRLGLKRKRSRSGPHHDKE